MPEPISPLAAPGAGGAAPGGVPIGSSPAATMPTPNLGAKAGAMAKLAVAVRLLSQIGNDLGVTDDVGRDVMQSALKLGKYVTPGSGSAGVEQNALTNLMRDQRAQQPMMQMLRGGAGGPEAAPPGAPPVAA